MDEPFQFPWTFIGVGGDLFEIHREDGYPRYKLYRRSGDKLFLGFPLTKADVKRLVKIFGVQNNGA